MRRLIIEEPVSRPAKWSPALASFALIVSVLAVLLMRFGRIDYQSGFIALGAGIAFLLMPFTPAGIPVVAAACAALIGLKQVRRVAA